MNECVAESIKLNESVRQSRFVRLPASHRSRKELNKTRVAIVCQSPPPLNSPRMSVAATQHDHQTLVVTPFQVISQIPSSCTYFRVPLPLPFTHYHNEYYTKLEDIDITNT